MFQDPRSYPPKPMMVLAIVGLGVCSWLAYHWLTQPILTAADVTLFSGKVLDAREERGDRGYLEITLADQPYPFRSFAPDYPNGFRFGLHDRLGPDVPVSIGVATSDLGHPSRNWIQNQKFYNFVTMSIAGSEALPLSVHNKSVESNRRYGPWFCLVMALVCIGLFVLGFRHRGSRRPMLEILREKRSSQRAKSGGTPASPG